ncbi:S8/S53 family peptidase [Chishuiella changwenlii]|uniref:S8/S53 family peptidase n=1 Tax=Chishuiella changwenlii TaxID=1434701 RepID=UPI002FDB30E0
MKKQLLFFATIFPILSFSQDRKNQFHLNSNSDDYSIYVKLKSENSANNKLKKEAQASNFFKKNEIEVIGSLYDKYDLRKLKKNSSIVDDKQSLEILNNIYEIKANKQSKEELLQLAKKLESFEEVEYVNFIGNSPIEPPYLKTSTTPNLEDDQTYLNSNPGIDAKYAWSIGVTGKHVNVINIEFGFIKNHEMLINLDHVQLEKGFELHPELLNPESQYSNFLDHGTATAGVITPSKNNIGLTGISFDVNSFTNFLEWTTKGYDRVGAVARALSSAKVGDIVTYEMQTFGENREYVPAEFDNLIWDLTKAATDAGIIVIAAAGNGSQNLDSPIYKSYMDRGDSGAIIIGAGSDDTTHSILSFSSYGSRVNLQAWGDNVLTAGYGYWNKYDNDNNRNYFLFAGTSSATAVMGGVATLIQSYYFQQTGKYLTPKELKKLLIETATPQGGDLTKNIGPHPDIKSAIEKLNSDYLSIKDPIKPLEIKVYPNPTKDIFYITNSENSNLDYTIFDLNGNILFKGKTKNTVNISSLTNGVYMLKVTDGKRIVIEKIIKN